MVPGQAKGGGKRRQSPPGTREEEQGSGYWEQGFRKRSALTHATSKLALKFLGRPQFFQKEFRSFRMDRETFLEEVRKQYAEKIVSAYMECEHGLDGQKRVNWIQVNQKLTKLMKNAQVDGLPAKDFMELVKAELPDAWEHLEPTWFRPAA